MLRHSLFYKLLFTSFLCFSGMFFISCSQQKHIVNSAKYQSTRYLIPLNSARSLVIKPYPFLNEIYLAHDLCKERKGYVQITISAFMKSSGKDDSEEKPRGQRIQFTKKFWLSQKIEIAVCSDESQPNHYSLSITGDKKPVQKG